MGSPGQGREHCPWGQCDSCPDSNLDCVASGPETRAITLTALGPYRRSFSQSFVLSLARHVCTVSDSLSRIFSPLIMLLCTVHSLILVFTLLFICVFLHLATVSLHEHLVAPTLAIRSEGQTFSPPRGAHRPQAGLPSLGLRPIFPSLQIKWVLAGSSKVTQAAGREAEAGTSVFHH